MASPPAVVMRTREDTPYLPGRNLRRKRGDPVASRLMFEDEDDGDDGAPFTDDLLARGVEAVKIQQPAKRRRRK